MSDIQVIDSEDGQLYQRIIWMKDEDYRRMSRLADRLDISKSEVIMAALKLYEADIFGEPIPIPPLKINRPPQVIDDFKKLNQGLVKFGADVSEPIDPARLRELLGEVPEEI